jgi:hypothetical protein
LNTDDYKKLHDDLEWGKNDVCSMSYPALSFFIFLLSGSGFVPSGNYDEGDSEIFLMMLVTSLTGFFNTFLFGFLRK